jgi:hypothetical protein
LPSSQFRIRQHLIFSKTKFWEMGTSILQRIHRRELRSQLFKRKQRKLLVRKNTYLRLRGIYVVLLDYVKPLILPYSPDSASNPHSKETPTSPLSGQGNTWPRSTRGGASFSQKRHASHLLLRCVLSGRDKITIKVWWNVLPGRQQHLGSQRPHPLQELGHRRRLAIWLLPS